MKYALNLAEDGRFLSATEPQYAPADAIVVDSLLEGDCADYRYVNGEWIYDPLPMPKEKPSQLDRIEAQITYTAMMTDSLLPEEVIEEEI